MRKKKKIICAVILLPVMLLSACTSNVSTNGETVPTKPVDAYEAHYAKDTLHKVNVTESKRPFIVNRKTEYKIIIGEGSHTNEAASNLVRYVREATGCELKFAEPGEYTAEGKFIVINVPTLFESAGLKMPEEELGTSGYYIKTVGDNVFMASNIDKGARFAVLAFMRHVLGFATYSKEMFVYHKDGSTLPDMDIIEKPDFDDFLNSNGIAHPDDTYPMGFMTDYFMQIDGKPFHNTLSYLPQATYQEEHPEWYSIHNDDICYTARGNEKELEQMVSTIADKILKQSDEEPLTRYVHVSMQDIQNICECESCSSVAQRYYGNYGAAVIHFTNKIARLVDKGLQERADATNTEKRDLTVCFFAYHKLVNPPVKRNTDGTYAPIDAETVCDDNVAVMFAPIDAKFYRSLYHEKNRDVAEQLKGWSALSDKLLLWLYETDFTYFLYPYNSWDSMMETYRFCKDNNAILIMSQGQHAQKPATGFSEFKDYINSRAAYDVNANYSEIVDEYFANYFGEAEVPMRKYFDELQAWMRNLEEQYPDEMNGGVYTDISKAKFWPKNLLDRWMGFIDDAYKAIEPLEEKDSETYKMLKKHIKTESIFLRFALLQQHTGKYSSDELATMRLAFKNDCKELGITRDSEGTLLSSVFQGWGL